MKLNIGDTYYTIGVYGQATTQKWNNDIGDNRAYAAGNIFKTQEEAEFEIEKRKVKAELERYALEHNDPDFEEWNGKNWHYYIRCFQECSTLEIGDLCSRRVESATYFTSEIIAKGAIKQIGADRIKKYIFGVEEKDS